MLECAPFNLLFDFNGNLVKFINFDDVIAKNKSRTLRSHSGATLIQKVLPHKNHSIATEFRLSCGILEDARLKIGDKVAVGFHQDNYGNLYIQIRAHNTQVGGYTISRGNKTSENQSGIIKTTWCEGLPLLINKDIELSVRCMSDDNETKYDVGELIIKFGKPEVLRRTEDTSQNTPIQKSLI